MIIIKRTDSANPHFCELVKELDKELAVRDGEEHEFYAQFNKSVAIKHVVIAYDDDEPAGCGAFKDYSPGTMEIKRMFVPLEKRGRGIASEILQELESWCRELGNTNCVLETGKNQPEAIALYTKNGYRLIPNYGQYAGIENSVCFEKKIIP